MLYFSWLSPPAVQSMESEIESIDNPVPDKKETKTAELLAELYLSAPSEPVKFCLRLYHSMVKA